MTDPNPEIDNSAHRHITQYPSPGGKIIIDGVSHLNFASNDYLDLSRHADVVAAAHEAIDQYGTGAGSSRLVSGSLPIHTQLENRLAEFKGYDAALLFGSGYMTNLGVVTALVGRSDHIFLDRLVHASIVDAAILSRATLHRFRHNDPDHLAALLEKAPSQGRRLVVTESVFSMNGDIAPLAQLTAAVRGHDAIFMVDVAHATGVFGPNGSGIVRELSLEQSVDLSMGTLSKALGAYGGFVACSHALRDLFINRSRALIYTTAPAPAAAAAALAAVNLLDPASCLDTHPATANNSLLSRASTFREQLREGGIDVGASQSQIIPIIVGDNQSALELSNELREHHIIAPAIRPPTVPEGSSRLRLSVTLAHTPEELSCAAKTICDHFIGLSSGADNVRPTNN